MFPVTAFTLFAGFAHIITAKTFVIWVAWAIIIYGLTDFWNGTCGLESGMYKSRRRLSYGHVARRLSILNVVFGGMAIFVGCLGLFLS
ncbi:hypothetical protein D6851_15860 [Altericroceibacterium spongiae]|uniref:Uncharacterized protein n=2 Tax=Altericroceibacterium spongiae TaxID=2320269 RepID=A0A420EAR0_9SPHN|nr:hypothetical protein D6851_15860 [Altericroceibacterium spongiae]